MRHFRKKCIAVICIVVAGVIQGCSEKDLLPPANTNAYIKFINAAPFIGSGSWGPLTLRASVTANGQPDTGALYVQYQQSFPINNQYLPYKEGSLKIDFKDTANKVLSAINASTKAGSYYSAVLIDSFKTYTGMILQDDIAPVSGKALVRILHFCPDAGEIVLYRDTTRLTAFGTPAFKNVSAFTPVGPGSNFSFIIRKNDGSNQRVARYFVDKLLPGAAYTILLKGYMQPPDGDIGNKSSRIIFYRD